MLTTKGYVRGLKFSHRQSLVGAAQRSARDLSEKTALYWTITVNSKTESNFIS
jgi:hypothetical protein